MILVGHHRNDGGYRTVLGRGGGGEDREVGVTGEVTGTTYTVHHLGTAYMGRVNVSVDIGFERGVDRDDTETAGVLLEAHILNFDGDLYGRRLRVRLLTFIRPEVRFQSVEELKAQIMKDIQIAERIS